MVNNAPTEDEKRSILRLERHAGFSWQLNLEDDKLITKNITNISPQGMAFKAPASAEISAGQYVKFTLSLNQNENFECEGRIMWSKTAMDRLGAMQQFGIQFMKLPSRLDATIMKAINDFELLKRREHLEKGLAPRNLRRNVPKKISFFSYLPTLLGGLLVVALTVAFLTAVWLHEQTHPEDSIAQKFNHSLKRKLSSSSEQIK